MEVIVPQRESRATLCLDSGGQIQSEREVRSIPVPYATRSYCPVSNGDFIDLVKHTADKMLGLEINREDYALSAKGQRMFGTITYQTDSSEFGLNIALRNSYDTGCSAGVACGQQVFVCDNLQLSATGAMFIRKHTTFIGQDLDIKVKAAVANAEYAYAKMTKEMKELKGAPVSLQRGYEVLGLAMGDRVISKQQASVAFDDWRKATTNPRHEEFSDRNAYTLYNCFTEGLKKGTPDLRISRQIQTHTFFSAQFLSALAAN